MAKLIFPRLHFFEDEVRIEFSNDSHSLDYDNQRDLLKKLFFSTQSGKLTFGQLRNLIEDLDQRSNPPFLPVKDFVEIKAGLHFSKGMTSQVMKTIFSKNEEEFNSIPEKDPAENSAFFEMCPCGKMHGRFYTQAGMVHEIMHTKDLALECLTELIATGYVNEEEIVNLKKQIAESPL